MARERRMPVSTLLVEELFSAQDPRFLSSIAEISSAKAIAPFATRWANDPRPWAREQKLTYFAQPLTKAGHQPVVKRLFKQALTAGDDELVAQCMVAFDRLIRRERRRRYHYDADTRQVTQYEVLYSPHNTLPQESYSAYVTHSWRLFTYATRQYLRRAAWRYFRRIGRQRPNEYCGAVAKALQLYTDEDVNKGEHLLECFALVHVCFHRHDALRFTGRRIFLKPGRKLAELTAAPHFAALWHAESALPVLLSLVIHAQARLVRKWAMELMQRHSPEAIEQRIPLATLLQLLDHSDSEVQQFAVSLLERSPLLPTQPLEFWLRLLDARDPTALATICQLMAKYVTRDRLSLAQCVQMANAKATPVARMGFDYLKEQKSFTANDRAALASLALARCEALGSEIALWALPHFAQPYDREAVSGFFDSMLATMRDGAWLWLLGNESAAHDPALFARLMETPYDDLRFKLINELQRRTSLPGVGGDHLKLLWASVLLGVHRGGRQKLKALEQLATALVKKPDTADELLPVFSVAIRSIRPSEMRAGLAAVMQVLEARPELAAALRVHLPELTFAAEEVA